MDSGILMGPLSAWELSCVEMVDNVYKRAYMQFNLINVHFPLMADLKWIFYHVENNSKSIGSVGFLLTFDHLILSEWFLTSTKC